MDHKKRTFQPVLGLTGHSLGAAMVEAFMKESWASDLFKDVVFEAMNFASPEYGFGIGGDDRVTSFWIDGDPITGATLFAHNIGDPNMIYHNVDQDKFGDSFHSMKLYLDFTVFFLENGLGGDEGTSFLFGGYNVSYLFGRYGTDRIKGDNGHEKLFASLHFDTLYGGQGQLRYEYLADSTLVSGDTNDNGTANLSLTVLGIHDLQADHFLL